MKHERILVRGAVEPAHVGRCLCGLLLACLPLAFLSASAEADDVAIVENGNVGHLAAGSPSGPGVWGDDTIGALPVIGDDGGLFTGAGLGLLPQILMSSAPSLYLEGDVADLKRMILDAWPNQAATTPVEVFVEPLAAGQARLIVRGAASIELNRGLFATGRVKVGMFTGFLNGGSFASFEVAGKQVARTYVAPSVMTPVGLENPTSLAALDLAPMEVFVHSSPKLAPGHMTFATTTHTVLLHQYQ